jgi:hypothetical protein
MPRVRNSDEFFDEDRFDEQISASLEVLVASGIVEIIGINEDGEWLYQMTKSGTETVKNMTMDDIDKLLGDDWEKK